MSEFSLIRNGYKRCGDYWRKEVMFKQPLTTVSEELRYYPATGRLRSLTKRELRRLNHEPVWAPEI